MDGSCRTLCWEILRDYRRAARTLTDTASAIAHLHNIAVTGCYTSPPASPVPPDAPSCAPPTDGPGPLNLNTATRPRQPSRRKNPATRRVITMPTRRTNHKERSTSGQPPVINS